MAEARSRARERGDRQRQALRPLGLVFLAVVVTASAQAHPAPALHGADLAVAVLLVAYAAAVLTAVSVGWARRGPAAQAAVIALIGGCGLALAVAVGLTEQPPVQSAITAVLLCLLLAVTGQFIRRGPPGPGPDRAAAGPAPGRARG